MLPTQNPQVLFQLVSDGAVLLHMEQEVYFGLNSVGAQVWQLLGNGCPDLADLCQRLQQMYPDAPPEQLRADVSELLDTLRKNLLVLEAA